MCNRNLRLLLILLFMSMLPLANFIYGPSPNTLTAITTRVVPLGTDSYAEDFMTTTNLDSGATTAEGWGDGTITSPRSYSVQLLDHYITSEPVRSVDVQGRKAYICVRPGSVGTSAQILNITDPTDITLMDTRGVGDTLITVEVDGDVLYIGTLNVTGYLFGLATYNVSNPYNIPSPMDYMAFDGNITDIEVQGHFIYLAINGDPNGVGNTLRIFDVEDPTNIQERDGIWYNDALGLDVKGQLVYIANGLYGLNIANCSDPYSIINIGWRDTLGNSSDVVVDGTLAYVADGSTGVQVFDVSDPTNPNIIGSYDTAGNANRLALQGDTLYVADGSNGLVVLDVADPTNPILVYHYALSYAWDVSLYGGIVVVAADDGVYTFKIGSLTTLPHVGTYGGHEAWDIRVQGDIAYVAAGPDGLITLDVSDPSNPVFLDQHIQGTTPFYRKLDVQGTHAYIANYNLDTSWRGVLVYDISDPTNIQYRGFFGTLTYATDVYVASDVIYVADGPLGVYIGNVSDPTNPTYITFVMPGENVTAVWVQGYHLYAVTECSAAEGLLIYDITDISNPTKIFSWSPVSTNHYDIFVDGDTAYVIDDGFSEHWNMTDPYNAYYSDYINFVDEPMGVWGFGPYMLAAIYGGGLALINTTDINNIDLIDSYTGAKGAIQVTVHGDFAYVANRSSLVILRLFNSAGATYITGNTIAQSLAVDTTDDLIENATLTATAYYPPGTSIVWQMSADGGTNWETVTPGVEHNFANTGSDLRWRATLNTPSNDRSTHLYSVDIDYEYRAATTLPPPIPGFPLGAIVVGAVLAIGLGLMRRRRNHYKG